MKSSPLSRLVGPSLIFFMVLYPFHSGASVDTDDSKYDFVTADGIPVKKPKNLEIHTIASPGKWAREAILHVPAVTSNFRSDGLEDIRVVTLSFSHPMEQRGLGHIQKIYLMDKDGYIVGYHQFSDTDRNASAKIKINGVINYVSILVICSEHGAWQSEQILTGVPPA